MCLPSYYPHCFIIGQAEVLGLSYTLMTVYVQRMVRWRHVCRKPVIVQHCRMSGGWQVALLSQYGCLHTVWFGLDWLWTCPWVILRCPSPRSQHYEVWLCVPDKHPSWRPNASAYPVYWIKLCLWVLHWEKSHIVSRNRFMGWLYSLFVHLLVCFKVVWHNYWSEWNEVVQCTESVAKRLIILMRRQHGLLRAVGTK